MSAENQKIIELSKQIKTIYKAINTAIREGDVTPEHVYLELKIDKGNFSRILSGQSNLPIEKISKFCEIVGNDLLIHWIAYQKGYELRIIPKTLEDKISQQEKEIKDLKTQLENVSIFVKKTMGIDVKSA